MPRRNNRNDYQGGQQYQGGQSVLQGARGYNQQGQGTYTNQGYNYNQPKQGNQGGRGRNNYQGGRNGGGGRGGPNQNRFQALAEGGDDGRQGGLGSGYTQGSSQGGRNQPGGYEGGQQQGRSGRGGAATTDWRALVKHDATAERPLWPLTCYSHLRSQPAGTEGRSAYPGGGGGPNDLEGDFQFEELRWGQKQASERGVPAQQLLREFEAAVEAQRRQIDALSRARRPPSLGGPPIPPLDSFLPPTHSLVALQSGATVQGPTALRPSPFGPAPAVPAGQAAGPFGRGPAPLFGGPAAHPGQGSGMFGSAGFGQQSGGGAFGASPSAFQGSSVPAQTAFGAPYTPQSQFGQQSQQPVLQPLPFGPPQHQPSLPSSNASPFPGSQPAQVGGAQPQPGFAGQPQAFVSGGQPAAAAEGSMQQTTGSNGATAEEDAVWRAPTFAPGCIPDKPPPSIYCQ